MRKLLFYSVLVLAANLKASVSYPISSVEYEKETVGADTAVKSITYVISAFDDVSKVGCSHRDTIVYKSAKTFTIKNQVEADIITDVSNKNIKVDLDLCIQSKLNDKSIEDDKKQDTIVPSVVGTRI